MKLKTVVLQNFRGYGPETRVPVGEFTALVGRNDAGKSSILEALDIFFEGGTIALDQGDLCKDAEGTEVRMGCTFEVASGELVLDESAATTLKDEYLLNAEGELEIVKVWDCKAAKPSAKIYIRAMHPSAAPFDGLLFAKNVDLKKLVKERGVEAQCELSSNPSMRAALRATAESLELRERDIPADDKETKAIWERIYAVLPGYALFQSDRASKVKDEEVQTPMKLAIKRAMNDVKEQLDAVVAQVQERALEIAAQTVAKLSASFPEVAQELHPRLAKTPDWSKVFDLVLDDDRGIPVDKRGSGVRRLILLSFFMTEIDRKREEIANGGKRSPMIYAIEEPETSQHPSNQLLILKALQDLSALGDQVLITTHTPALTRHIATHDLRFITRDAQRRPVVRHSDESTLDDIALELGVFPSPLGKPADGVRVALVVEGPNDEDALIALSNALRAAGHTTVSLVEPCPAVFKVLGGGSTLQHWVDRRHLDKLGLPQVHIYDSDVSPEQPGGKAETHARAAAVNAGGKGKAFVTRRRCMDNYLHHGVVSRELGIEIVFADCGAARDDMESLVCAQVLQAVRARDDLRLDHVGRNGKPLRLRKDDAKEWISRYFMPRMTADEALEVGRYTDEATGAERNEVLEWMAALEEHLSPPA